LVMALKPSALINPLAEAARTSKRISGDVIHAAAFSDATNALLKDAKAVGLATEARAVERATNDIIRDARAIDDIEQVLVKQRPGLRPMSAVFATSAPPRPNRLDHLFRRFSQRDRHALGELALRLMQGRSRVSQGLLHNMAGALREVVAKTLPDIVREVEQATAALHRGAQGSGVLSPIDTAVHGAVQLPTRLKGSERSIKLGTDRLVGMGRIEPQRVTVAWSDGTRTDVDVAGVLDVTLAIEIKRRTTATAGIEQLRFLQARGQRGYADIGGQLWLLNYEPSRVTHLVVAPPGESITRAVRAAKEETQGGHLTKVIEIPIELDNQTIELARAYLEAAAGSAM
jgi:hypothetical protein